MKKIILYSWNFANKHTMYYLQGLYESLGYKVIIKD